LEFGSHARQSLTQTFCIRQPGPRSDETDAESFCPTWDDLLWIRSAVFRMSPPGCTDRTAPGRTRGGLSEFLHSWRYFIWLIGLVAVVGLFFAEENWRGQWAWNRYKRAMAARGEPLELSAVVPPKPPDDQNFTMTPVLAPLFAFMRGASPGSSPLNSIGLFASNYDNASRELKATNVVRSNSWIQARTDLPAWYAALLNSASKPGKQEASAAAADFTLPKAAAGVLSELSEADPVFAELQAASQLPSSRFNIHYDDEDPAAIMLPHLAVVKYISQVLALHACAELALGQTDQAFEDTRLLLFLADACKDEPFLVSQLVRMAQLNIALQPVAEGMTQWSEPQLCALQAQIAHYDFCADTRRALGAERFWSSQIIEYVQRSRDRLNLIAGISGSQQSDFALGAVLMSIAPSGWFALEQLNCSRMADECLLPTIDVASRRINPRLAHLADERIGELANRSAAGLYFHHLFFCRLLLSGVSKAGQRAAFAQAAADCALIACALERYRREHGEFPELLSALQPRFTQKLPHDIISGAPLKYHRTETGQYVLYSVGWNETDDAGIVGVVRIDGGNSPPQGDWVWRLP
jgi:hypothetical protein